MLRRGRPARPPVPAPPLKRTSSRCRPPAGLKSELRRSNWELGRERLAYTTTSTQLDPRAAKLPSAKLSRETMSDLRREHFRYGDDPMRWQSTAQADFFTDRGPAQPPPKPAMTKDGAWW